MKKYLLPLALFSGFSIFAMEKPLSIKELPLLRVTIPYNDENLQLSLADAHIFTHQKVVDRTSLEEKIIGLHYYCADQVAIRQLKGAQLIELNDHAWIYTEGDISTFHTGYPIYQGKVYPKKTFFPSTWSKQQVLEYIASCDLSSSDTILREQSDGLFKRLIVSARKGAVGLRFIIVAYPHKHVLISVFPELDTKRLAKKYNLDVIAHEQIRKLAQKPLQSKKAQPELIKAVEAADQERVLALLKEGCDPTICDDQQRTPLMLAASKGRYDIMGDLIEHGASLVDAQGFYIKDKKGISLLDYALRSLNEFAVLPLLHPGHAICLTELNREGHTPLIFAIHARSVEIVQLLLSCGADPNLACINGYTPLMHVIRSSGKSEEEVALASHMAKLLVHYGADLDAANIKSKRQHGHTALMCAVEENSKALTNLLLDSGADYELVNTRGHSAAAIAANKGLSEMGEVVRKYDAQKQAWKKENNGTELMFAVHRHTLSRVKKRLKKDNVNHSGKDEHLCLVIST